MVSSLAAMATLAMSLTPDNVEELLDCTSFASIMSLWPRNHCRLKTQPLIVWSCVIMSSETAVRQRMMLEMVFFCNPQHFGQVFLIQLCLGVAFKVIQCSSEIVVPRLVLHLFFSLVLLFLFFHTHFYYSLINTVFIEIVKSMIQEIYVTSAKVQINSEIPSSLPHFLYILDEIGHHFGIRITKISAGSRADILGLSFPPLRISTLFKSYCHARPHHFAINR